MNILLLNAHDSGGGAAIAATRLTKALRDYGAKARLGVIRKKSALDFVDSLGSDKDPGLGERALRKIHAKLRGSSFSTSNPVIHSENRRTRIDVRRINEDACDIVHLHWINDDMISIEDLARIRKPIVWTLHDSWPFCGAEHYSNVFERDERYREGYWRDNKPESTRGRDICRAVWERKIKAWEDLRIHFVAPSFWERRMLQESALFRDASCMRIPNVIPSSIFHPRDKAEARRVLGLPASAKLIGFGSAYGMANRNSIKGGNWLVEALRRLSSQDGYSLLAFGPLSSDFAEELDLPLYSAGMVENPAIMSALYSCCDAIVMPSAVENLATTALEALFCGVPVAAFDSGGNGDIIEHRTTGYLAPAFDPIELAEGIRYCVDNGELLSRNSVEKAKRDFSEADVVRRHLELYEGILNGETQGSKSAVGFEIRRRVQS